MFKDGNFLNNLAKRNNLVKKQKSTTKFRKTEDWPLEGKFDVPDSNNCYKIVDVSKKYAQTVAKEYNVDFRAIYLSNKRWHNMKGCILTLETNKGNVNAKFMVWEEQVQL